MERNKLYITNTQKKSYNNTDDGGFDALKLFQFVSPSDRSLLTHKNIFRD